MGKAVRSYGEMINYKQSAKITADDVVSGACIMLSLFIPDPQFQGQTKEKLSSPEATKLVEASIGDHFDHWLSADPARSKKLLEYFAERAEMRRQRRQEKVLKRQSATKKLRLPGKLSDCTQKTRENTEIFIVEGDSAGGSAKQARSRANQAVLPLRGKILNVASATADKMRANQELNDLNEALGCGTGARYDEDALRYEKVIIMTDADVDGAHIASLLMTYFFLEMHAMVANGHLYIAQPPLYRLTQGAKTIYARDDAHKDHLMETGFEGRGKIEVSRFKGLGEMPPAQLKETAMNPETRTLLRVTLPAGLSDEDKVEEKETNKLVDDLMGKKPELRLAFIQAHAAETELVDV